MKSTVNVVADNNGNVIIQSKNPEFGYIKISQTRMRVDDSGFLKSSNYIALIKGKIDDLKVLNFSPGQKISGNIIIIEKTSAINPKSPERNLKINYVSGEVMTDSEGNPIYRDTIWDPTGLKEDILIQTVSSEKTKIVIPEKKIVKTPTKTKSVQTSIMDILDGVGSKVIGGGDSVMLVPDQNETKEETINNSESNEEVVEETEEIIIPEVIVEEDVVDESVEEIYVEEEEEEEEEEEYLFEL
tara:strand:+ start:6891 stop:7619 length:729 start_codon:yes stop_codon:yes gene_type:complete